MLELDTNNVNLAQFRALDHQIEHIFRQRIPTTTNESIFFGAILAGVGITMFCLGPLILFLYTITPSIKILSLSWVLGGLSLLVYARRRR